MQSYKTVNLILSIFRESGKEKILFDGAFGPSAINMNSRFTKLSKEVTLLCKKIYDSEQAVTDIAQAEVASLRYLPAANISTHHRISELIIDYFGLPCESDKIRINELYLAVKNDQLIVLWKQENGNYSEVCPRFFNAANYEVIQDPIIHFFGDYQLNKLGGGYYFSWGYLENFFTFLPRVEYKDIILRPAQWNVSAHFVKDCNKSNNCPLDLLKKFKIPDRFYLTEGDNKMFFNLENKGSKNVFISKFKKLKGALKLQEYLDFTFSCVKDAKSQSYIHELIIPAIITNEVSYMDRERATIIQGTSENLTIEENPWGYAKIYCNEYLSDYVLRNFVYPLFEFIYESKATDRYFFTRYTDSYGFHLRLRFRKTSIFNFDVLLEKIYSLKKNMSQGEAIYSIVFDGYKQEYIKYRFIGLEVTEKIFFKETLFVHQIINTTENENRWLLGLSYMNFLLTELGFSIAEKKLFISSEASKFRREFEFLSTLNGKKKLSKRYRENEKKIQRAFSDFSTFTGIVEPYKQDYRNFLSLANDFRCNFPSEEVQDLAWNLFHMFCNRLFEGNNRLHEAALYMIAEKYVKSVMFKSKE